MTIQELDQLIEEGNSLKQIAQAYSEIAVLKLKKIRGMLDRNRVFFNEISAVYGLVKSFAQKKGFIVPKPKKRVSIIMCWMVKVVTKSSLFGFSLFWIRAAARPISEK